MLILVRDCVNVKTYFNSVLIMRNCTERRIIFNMPRKENRTIELGNEPFPIALKILLDEKKISQKDLAEYLKVTRQTVSVYCLGYSSPDYKTLCKIADFFNVSTDYLLGRTNVKTTDTTVKYISEYLGLSEEFVLHIPKRMKERDEKYKKYFSSIIMSSIFDFFILSILKLKHIKENLSSQSITDINNNLVKKQYYNGDEVPINILDVTKYIAETHARKIIDFIISDEPLPLLKLKSELTQKDIDELEYFLNN